MANKVHVRRLKEGVNAWNTWRHKNDVIPDLSDADLKGCILRGANLSHANLSEADLDGSRLNNASLERANLYYANLSRADLSNANLTGAELHEAKLDHGNLSSTNLSGARLEAVTITLANMSNVNLRDAVLGFTILRQSKLGGADMTDAFLEGVVFADIDLSNVIGLETCVHGGPSSIDHLTLHKSGPLPLRFLRGVGLTDAFIEYLPSILHRAIQHYSCFISYSSKDQAFADRLYSDLQNKGVRCWFAPHDMPIGGKILDEIDSAIRLRDKLLLILSAQSIASEWVEDEVTNAFEEERKRNQVMLFPIRLDDAVMETSEAWASKLRARHIGDFRRWKDHDAYTKSFERVLRDLTVKKDGEQ
jgi:TIR domain/Pentapeptide repeats (8 copies)